MLELPGIFPGFAVRQRQGSRKPGNIDPRLPALPSGERLFDRSTRRAALTPFGRDRLPTAKRLVQPSALATRYQEWS
jgi:hypothetical protein